MKASDLSDAEKLCTLCSGIFFLTGLLTGVWKWRCMATSKSGSAPHYVDVAHRASLMYSFAALLLGHFASLNDLSSRVNVLAVSAPLLFFGLAINTYVDPSPPLVDSDTGVILAVLLRCAHAVCAA
jgi:hypothetical protein